METLQLFLSAPTPPAFIYLHHPHQPTTSLSWPTPPPGRGRICKVDAVESHTPKSLWSTIISRLEGRDAGVVDTMDAFLRGLRTFSSSFARAPKGKGKEKEKEVEPVCIVVTKAERLPKVLGPNWTAMTRLTELAGTPICVVLASSVPWDELRPPRGDALEPVHLYLRPHSRDDILRTLLPTSSHPLWPRFLDLILSTLLPLTSLPSEIEYIASALWPIYIASLPPHAERGDPDASPLPSITVKLLTDLKHQLTLPLTAAVESVLTRQIGRAEFTKAMTDRRPAPKAPGLELPIIARFLLVAAYCASYNPAKSDLRLFGRGTGPDGRRKKGGGTRRAGYGRVRIGKVPQRLQGPKPFPLDRLLAIFASLYAEHAPRPDHLFDDDDISDSDTDEDTNPDAAGGQYLTIAEQAARAEKKRRKDGLKDDIWDEEVEHLTMSVKLWSLIPELEHQGILRRVSPIDRLDNIMLRCELDHGSITELAKDLKIVLDDYIYEAVS